MSSLALNTFRDGASPASLGILFQCLITLIINNFLLVSNLNLPFFSLKLLSLVLSLQDLVKCYSPSLHHFGNFLSFNYCMLTSRCLVSRVSVHNKFWKRQTLLRETPVGQLKSETPEIISTAWKILILDYPLSSSNLLPLFFLFFLMRHTASKWLELSTVVNH